MRNLIRKHGLNTVCEEARCPNRGECWGGGTATFLILGNLCTRNCRFCAVKSAKPAPPDETEPLKVSQAVRLMGLRHAVITSVTRDDLADGGASLFAETIRQIRLHSGGCSVEVLVPDFGGSGKALTRVLEVGPEILAHNVETVPRLCEQIRPHARYERSLQVLKRSGELNPDVLTKSGLMLGLGESIHEIREVMADLRRVGCDILTLGQYLRPTRHHLPVVRYRTPREFEMLKSEALQMGFAWVESGPLVRSSFRAGAVIEKISMTPSG